ncbi:hypothetical protein Hanom_Chr02g00151871 [Helianthus anomalus]
MALDDEMHVAELFDPWAGDDCSQYSYMVYPARTYEAKRFNKLREMKVGCMRGIHWDSLETCGVAGIVPRVIGHDSPWDRLFRIGSGSSYQPLMVEFLSTFRYRPRPADRANSNFDDLNLPAPLPEITFRLFNEVFQMSLRQFAVAIGFYTDAEFVQDLYTTTIDSDVTSSICHRHRLIRICLFW